MISGISKRCALLLRLIAPNVFPVRSVTATAMDRNPNSSSWSTRRYWSTRTFRRMDRRRRLVDHRLRRQLFQLGSIEEIVELLVGQKRQQNTPGCRGVGRQTRTDPDIRRDNPVHLDPGRIDDIDTIKNADIAGLIHRRRRLLDDRLRKLPPRKRCKIAVAKVHDLIPNLVAASSIVAVDART